MDKVQERSHSDSEVLFMMVHPVNEVTVFEITRDVFEEITILCLMWNAHKGIEHLYGMWLPSHSVSVVEDLSD
jgi:hypothetical protein